MTTPTTFSIHDDAEGPFPAIVLADDATASRVTVLPARGAIVTSFVAAGREQLYLDRATLLDASQNVRGGIPVLFPSPGRLEGDAFAREGARGAMKQHGFARTSPFLEVERGTTGSAWVRLQLVDSPTTLAQFPFAFRLELTFRLHLGALHIRADVHATGERPLPFALGYHPYFAVPVADKPTAAIPTRATRAWDNVAKREIAFTGMDLAAGEVDLHLVDHGSTGATLQAPAGGIDLAGHFSRWVVWTLPGKDFVCLEPWTAPANALNTGEGLITVQPGSVRSFELSIAPRESTLEAAGSAAAPPGPR